jgi:hypothetical protein
MIIKFFTGGGIYSNNVSPGIYPKWSKMHLRIWCIGRLENTVLLTLRVMYRSAPLMAFVFRQLGASSFTGSMLCSWRSCSSHGWPAGWLNAAAA